MTFPSEHDFALFLFQLFVVLLTALGLGELFRRLGQPTIVGEILGGVILGPSVFGALAPNLWESFLPGAQTQLLGNTAWLGSVFFLLLAGTEVNLTTLHREGRAVLWTSFTALVVPFALGVVFALNIGEKHLADPSRLWIFALFIGTAMSVSAIPVIARILMELDLLKKPIGTIIIGAAVVNDLIGWIFFAVILGMIGTNVADKSVTAIILLTLFFALFCLTLGRKAVAWLFRLFHVRQLPREGILGFAALLAFLCAGITQWIGIHAIFGAFLAGVMLGETEEVKTHTHAALHNFVVYVFAPIFFATMGMRANFLRDFDLSLVAGVFVVACAGKMIGGAAGALLGGMKIKDALAAGFGLNARGAMEIILAFLALEYDLINEQVFVALVITAVGTAAMSGPLIKWTMKEDGRELKPSRLST
jgi:Kef-type K+ transport system membrane component KefB